MEIIVKIVAGVIILVVLLGLAVVFFVPQIQQAIHSFGRQVGITEKQRQPIVAEITPLYITEDMSTVEKIRAIFENFDLNYRWYGSDDKRDYGYFNITLQPDESSGISAGAVGNAIQGGISSWYNAEKNKKMFTSTSYTKLISPPPFCTGSYINDKNICDAPPFPYSDYHFEYCERQSIYCIYCKEYNYNTTSRRCEKYTKQPAAAPALEYQNGACVEPKKEDYQNCGNTNGPCGLIRVYSQTLKFSSPIKIYVHLYLNNDYGYIPYVSVCQG